MSLYFFLDIISDPDLFDEDLNSALAKKYKLRVFNI